MADSPDRIDSLVAAWTSFGRVLAVVAAALVALAGTLLHVPVWLAAARGLGTLIAVQLIVRGSAAAIRALPRARAPQAAGNVDPHAPRTARKEAA